MSTWEAMAQGLRDALREERLLCQSVRDHWPEVRAVHLRSQHRSIPFVVGLNLFFVLLTAGVFSDTAGWAFLCLWLGLNVLWCLYVLRAWWLRRRRNYVRARPWAITRVQLGTTALSLLWSSAVLAWLGQADEVGRNFMVAVVVGAMCVGSLGLSALATAAWSYLLPLSLATATTLTLYPRTHVAYELFALACYTLALAGFALHISRLITAHVLAERRLRLSLQELELARTHLHNSEKLASLGALVAGVSHEVNTPLGVAVTAGSCVEDTLVELRAWQAAGGPDPATLDALLEEAAEGVGMLQHNLARASKLLSSFKQTAVHQVDDRLVPFDAMEVLRALLTSLQPVLRRVPVEPVLLGPQRLMIRSYPSALIQIVTNLLMNSAQHAFESVDKPSIQIEMATFPGHWTLRYQDNGVGVSPELQPRIFEPFFTTRRGKGGTGLGLSIVHTLATQSLGGRLQVWSELGAGLRFTLELPHEPPPRADWLAREDAVVL